jgi:hypothetical protein
MKENTDSPNVNCCSNARELLHDASGFLAKPASLKAVEIKVNTRIVHQDIVELSMPWGKETIHRDAFRLRGRIEDPCSGRWEAVEVVQTFQDGPFVFKQVKFKFTNETGSLTFPGKLIWDSNHAFRWQCGLDGTVVLAQDEANNYYALSHDGNLRRASKEEILRRLQQTSGGYEQGFADGQKVNLTAAEVNRIQSQVRLECRLRVDKFIAELREVHSKHSTRAPSWYITQQVLNLANEYLDSI